MVGVATSGLVYGLGGVAGLISVGRLTLDDTDDGSGGFALSHPWSVTYGIAQAIGRYGGKSAAGRLSRNSSDLLGHEPSLLCHLVSASAPSWKGAKVLLDSFDQDDSEDHFGRCLPIVDHRW